MRDFVENNNHKVTTIVGSLALCWGILGISVMSWSAYIQFTSGDYQGGTGGVIFGLIYSVIAITGSILILKRKKIGQYMLWFIEPWAAIDNTLHYDDLSAPYLLPLTLLVIRSLPTIVGKDLE